MSRQIATTKKTSPTHLSEKMRAFITNIERSEYICDRSTEFLLEMSVNEIKEALSEIRYLTNYAFAYEKSYKIWQSYAKTFTSHGWYCLAQNCPTTFESLLKQNILPSLDIMRKEIAPDGHYPEYKTNTWIALSRTQPKRIFELLDRQVIPSNEDFFVNYKSVWGTLIQNNLSLADELMNRGFGLTSEIMSGERKTQFLWPLILEAMDFKNGSEGHGLMRDAGFKAVNEYMIFFEYLIDNNVLPRSLYLDNVNRAGPPRTFWAKLFSISPRVFFKLIDKNIFPSMLFYHPADETHQESFPAVSIGNITVEAMLKASLMIPGDEVSFQGVLPVSRPLGLHRKKLSSSADCHDSYLFRDIYHKFTYMEEICESDTVPILREGFRNFSFNIANYYSLFFLRTLSCKPSNAIGSAVLLPSDVISAIESNFLSKISKSISFLSFIDVIDRTEASTELFLYRLISFHALFTLTLEALAHPSKNRNFALSAIDKLIDALTHNNYPTFFKLLTNSILDQNLEHSAFLPILRGLYRLYPLSVEYKPAFFVHQEAVEKRKATLLNDAHTSFSRTFEEFTQEANTFWVKSVSVESLKAVYCKNAGFFNRSEKIFAGKGITEVVETLKENADKKRNNASAKALLAFGL